MELNQWEMVVRLFRTVKTIEEAAAMRCAVCAMLIKILAAFDVINDSRNPNTVVHLLIPIAPNNPQILFSHHGTQTVVQIYMSTVTNRPWNNIMPLPDVSADRLSEQSLGFIRSSLSSCLQTHLFCRQAQAQGKVPTRLIDVGIRGEREVRLVETRNIDPAPDYIALSYCWGDSTTVKTTRANIDAMKAGIELANSPQTFVDAFRLTRELNIRFLWIDAFCIIQDDLDDWDRESASMSSIYANAYLTIAVASSVSVAVGFLSRYGSNSSDIHVDEYERRVFSKRVCEDTDDDINSRILKARVIPQSGIHWKWQDDYLDRHPREPWARRGWTLQEQLLSTRLLYVSSTEMQWTCRETEVCECRSTLNRGRQFGGTPLALMDSSADVFRFWKKVIENYSLRSLTQHGDKLPAISGIADVVQRKTGSSYVAGLWADNIDLDLLWRRTSPLEEGALGNATMPSFSWASVDGEIDYYCFRNGKQPYHRISSVMSLEVRPIAHQAPLGRVAGGKLLIKGPLVPATIEALSVDGWMFVKIGSTVIELTADTLLGELLIAGPSQQAERVACRQRRRSVIPSSSMSLHPSGSVEKIDAQFANHHSVSVTARPPGSGTQCWVLRLGAFFSDSTHPYASDNELLVLGRLSSSPDYYERLGLASYRGDELAQVFDDTTVTAVTIM
ncbi:hypothetical protein QQS21_006927 [Conoideocrella luteorostrata]|uniref:Heterokaryon incompatibility domain-containing protein n=1 Tax=Conoideocrella luteorostrata TaxID=1105319 RepID=A0AAJ0CPK9_9HYPO|nr:hypothetical protein QQS21_006927 [Conoideocrella luteorostrata]